MNVYLPNLRLPSAYQEVEYIQSSGTQYIKIGTSFKTSYKVVIDFQMDVIGGDYVPIGINNYDGVNPTYRYGIDAYSSYFHVSAGGNWTSTKSEDTNRHTIIIDKNTAIVDGTSYTIGYSNYTYSSGICVFCYNEYNKSSPYNYKSSNKLYKLDIYDENGNHIYDLVPCYRKSDNVIGLYDLVNNQFYTNAGTGTFSKGNDVTMAVLKNAYIGEVWTPGTNTLLYLPFSDDLNDHSSNQTSTKGGTVSITTLDGVNCANFNSGYLTFPSKKWFDTNWTISLRVKNPNNTTSGTSSIFMTSGVGGAGTEYGFLWNVIDSPYYINSNTYGSSRNNYVRYGYTKPSGWTHIVATQQGLTGKLYVNGTLVATNSSFSDNNITANTLYIGNNTDDPSVSKWWLKAYLSELIIENTVWDATKVAHYYNLTKSNYGL